MSGPKGCSVQVVSAQELERRALVAARARYDEAARRAERLARELKEAERRGVDVPARVHHGGAPSTSAACERAAGELDDACDWVERELLRRVGEHLAQRLVEGLTASQGHDDGASLVVTPVEVVLHGGRPVPVAGATPAEDGWRDRVAASVHHALACLGDLQQADWEAVRSRALAVLAATESGRAHTLLLVLQDDVDARLRAATDRRALERQAQEFRARLAAVEAVDASTAQGLRHRLDVALRTAGLACLPQQLFAELASVEARARSEADRRYALQAAAQCLAELGYEVDEGFETVAPGRPEYVSRPDWQGYAVQVRTLPATGDIIFNVVRSQGVPSTARDTQIETAWCEDFRAARVRAGQLGVSIDLKEHVPAGVVPVQVVEESVVSAPGRRRRSRVGQPRARQMGLG